MVPVDINVVECQIGSKYASERTGKAEMKFNPVDIQEWILRETGLSCMNFSVAFQDLSDEVKAYNEEHGKKLPAAVEEKWDQKLEEVLEQCRKAILEAPASSHDCSVRRKYALGDSQAEKQEVRITFG